MLDISTILNNETFTPEEQLEIIKYIDAQLEQMELLLYRLDQLARRASRDDIMEEERLRLQEKSKQIQEEIDRISERLPNTYIITNDDSN
ncbi:hypothetical protein C818_01784 [Lachnospiraceae bacterium MD308]|jgi:hypothetical protein|nr:hypothetical protein C818_01784 [Lachnospiraceae bacterium MD308]